GRHRPHARRRRHCRIGGRAAGAAAGLRARHAALRGARSRLRPAARAPQRTARLPPGDEQLLRLRRQQLLPAVRPRMNATAPRLAIEGVGFWASGLPGFAALRGFLRDGTLPDAAPARPAPALLPANERRRAPDTVLLALDAAQQACAMAGRDP